MGSQRIGQDLATQQNTEPMNQGGAAQAGASQSVPGAATLLLLQFTASCTHKSMLNSNIGKPKQQSYQTIPVSLGTHLYCHSSGRADLN